MKTTWWLDTSALPDLCWARLQVFDDGRVEVLDLDGRRHPFASEGDARAWLNEDEYDEVGDLQAEGVVDGSINVPVAPSDAALLPLLLVRRT